MLRATGVGSTDIQRYIRVNQIRIIRVGQYRVRGDRRSRNRAHQLEIRPVVPEFVNAAALQFAGCQGCAGTVDNRLRADAVNIDSGCAGIRGLYLASEIHALEIAGVTRLVERERVGIGHASRLQRAVHIGEKPFQRALYRSARVVDL